MRDFTYIDDIVDGINSLIYKSPAINSNFDLNMPKPSESWAPFKLFNLGNSNPVKLMSFIRTIEENLGIEAKKEFLPMQMGDVKKTYADTEAHMSSTPDRARYIEPQNASPTCKHTQTEL